MPKSRLWPKARLSLEWTSTMFYLLGFIRSGCVSECRKLLDAVPAAVWEYTIGGYQVLKKWLSYRE